MKNEKIIYKISKIARNSLELDLIRACEVLYKESMNDIERYKELILVPFFNSEKIEQYEKFMNLTLEKNWSLEDRRDRIIYTLLSKSTFTKNELKNQAKLFTNGDIEIDEDYRNYSFTVNFTSIVGIPKNMQNFKRFIELNKPAHLGYSVKFRYNTHGQLNEHKLTHKELSNYTHKQIREIRIFED